MKTHRMIQWARTQCRTYQKMNEVELSAKVLKVTEIWPKKYYFVNGHRPPDSKADLPENLLNCFLLCLRIQNVTTTSKVKYEKSDTR